MNYAVGAARRTSVMYAIAAATGSKVLLDIYGSSMSIVIIFIVL